MIKHTDIYKVRVPLAEDDVLTLQLHLSAKDNPKTKLDEIA